MKTVLRLLCIVLVFLGITAIGISSQVASAAGAELSHKIASFETDNGYKSPVDGVKIRGYFTKDATSIIKVTYTAVVISFISDEVKVDSDSGEITLNGEIVTDEYIVGSKTKQKNIEVAIQNVANPTPNKTKFVEVRATEWCAFVFAVHYKGTNDEDLVTYGSDVVTCTTIDSGIPDAYRTGVWVKQADAIEYEIMIRSDRLGQARSHDTGINYFVVYKGASKTADAVEIDRKNNVGSTFFRYKLTISLKEKAFYRINVVDNVGNNAIFDVGENNNIKYDEGFESAFTNALIYLEDNKLYAPSVHSNLEKAYYGYYMIVQDSKASETDKYEAKNIALPYLTEFARLKKLEEASKKEYTLSVTNSEYVDGEISLINADIALDAILYGEKATININLALFDALKVDRTKEMQVAGVANCRQILSLNLSSSKNGAEYNAEFFKPLQISVPLTNYQNVKATISIPLGDGSFDIKVVDIIYYKDYIVLNASHSYSTINVFIDEESNKSLLWLLTLLVIPVTVGVFAIIKITKNKKKNLEGDNDKPTK